MTEQAKGGFDGILVTFGEGTDDDTFNRVFCYPLMGITLADGTTFDAWQGSFGFADGALRFEYQPFDDQTSEGVGDRQTVLAEHIVGINVY